MFEVGYYFMFCILDFIVKGGWIWFMNISMSFKEMCLVF